MNHLGEEIIKQKSKDVANQISQYLSSHPEKTVKDLQNDPVFQEIAVQSVGTSGYTTVMDAKTLINRFYKTASNVSTDYHSLATTKPEFYSILQAGGDSNDSSGYYNWTESNGVTNLKYAYYTCANKKTADGVTFRIGATTYIDEFSKPSEEVKQSISDEISAFNEKIQSTIVLYSIIILIIIIIGALFAIFVGFKLSEGITRPVKKLTDGVRNIAEGNLTYRIGDIDGDELGELGRSIDFMAQEIEEHNKSVEMTQVRQKNANNDLLVFTQKVQNGDLNSRINTAGYDGELFQILTGVNEVLDSLVMPIQETIRISKSYANCNFQESFSDTITLKGDFQEFKSAIEATGTEVSGALMVVLSEMTELSKKTDEATHIIERIKDGSCTISQNSSNTKGDMVKTLERVSQIQNTMTELKQTVNLVRDTLDTVVKNHIRYSCTISRWFNICR